MLTKKILPSLRQVRNLTIDRSMKYYLIGDRETMHLYDVLYWKISDALDLARRICDLENSKDD